MARKKKPKVVDLVAERKACNMNQAEYWQRFGVTQSGGSRYESGRAVPRPLQILMALYRAGSISDADLIAARKQ